MIKIGENPEQNSLLNKFRAKSGDGQRGRIIAFKKDHKQAVILALNNSIELDVEWGKFYLIEEQKPDEYPIVVKSINRIPLDGQWKISEELIC